MSDPLKNGLIDWMTHWLTVSLTDSLTHWFPDSLTQWLTHWLIGWLTDWQTDSMTDWLTHSLINWLTDWLNDLLTSPQGDHVWTFTNSNCCTHSTPKKRGFIPQPFYDVSPLKNSHLPLPPRFHYILSIIRSTTDRPLKPFVEQIKTFSQSDRQTKRKKNYDRPNETLADKETFNRLIHKWGGLIKTFLAISFFAHHRCWDIGRGNCKCIFRG